MNDVITIGIAGGTGSGKTTITRRILDEFGGDVSVLYHDNYYKRHDDIPFAERKKLNYDHPNAFDTPLLVQHLDALRAGQPVACPTYDYTVHNRAAETITVVPAKVVVVEDLVSTGGSSLSAVEALREAGCDVLGMVAIFTYGFPTAAENFAGADVKLDTLSDYKTMIELAAKQGYVHEDELQTLQQWRRDPANWKKSAQ